MLFRRFVLFLAKLLAFLQRFVDHVLSIGACIDLIPVQWHRSITFGLIPVVIPIIVGLDLFLSVRRSDNIVSRPSIRVLRVEGRGRVGALFGLQRLVVVDLDGEDRCR